MAQTFFPITPVEVTPGTPNTWADVNVAAYAPSGATGVLLHIVNSTGTPYAIGLRKNGSTDNRTQVFGYYDHCWAAIGVDSSRIFEAFVGSTTAMDIYLVGYTMSGVTFFTNAHDKSLGTTGAWIDINCAAQAPGAAGLIFEISAGSTATFFGLRKNGSSDNRTATTGYHCCFGAIIGCDTSQICEGYISTTQVDFYLVGYITDGCTFNLNATDVSLGSVGSWLDLPALPASANMGFIEVTASDYYDYGLRKNGSTENIYEEASRHPWVFVECDVNHIIEGKIANTAVDFFVIGYSTVPQAGYKDIATRFKLISQLYKDISTRFGLYVPTYQDVSTRFCLSTWKSLQILEDIAALEAKVAGLKREPKAHFEI